MGFLNTFLRVVFKSIKIIWTSPNTAIGLMIGTFGLLSGGRVIKSSGAIEFHGGLVTAFLKRTPINASAMTLGHTILGQSIACLDRTRAHEMVHVRQYERWGIFFLPAYFGMSFVMWLKGKRAYRDNPFEVEAYDATE